MHYKPNLEKASTALTLTKGIFLATLPIKSILQPTLKSLWRSAVRLDWNYFQSHRLTFPLRFQTGIGHFDTRQDDSDPTDGHITQIKRFYLTNTDH